jgi:predicted phage terminase large subunit-like protein
MREYMHTHIVEGTIFKNKWIQYKQRLQYRQYDALCLYGDLSYKNAGDFKALILAGKKTREFHVLDCYVRQTSRNNAALWLYQLAESDHLLKYNISYWIEGLFAMDEFVNDFDLVGDQKGWYIPVIPDKRSKAGKHDRIEGMSGYFERGNVWFNKAIENSTDCKELVDQLLTFQKGSGAHDDAPDALHGAISKLNVAAMLNTNPPLITSRKQINHNKKNRF